MTLTPDKAFKSLATKFSTLKRSGDSKRVAEFMASPKFFQTFAALTQKDRLRIQEHIQGAMAAGAKHAANKLPPIPKYSPRVWWTPERIQQLMALYNTTGSDHVVAAKMGISWDAARRARFRYIGHSVTMAMAA